MESLFIKNLAHRLSKALPGKSAHDIMMVTPRLPFPKINLDKKGIPASVLILLFPKNNQWHFFLTKRTSTVNHHKGQISLPGGVVETGESLEGAALRETHEEIGVPKDNVEVLGSLSELFIIASNFKVLPTIGVVRNKPNFIPDPIEVADVLPMPLAALKDPALRKVKEMKFPPYTIQSPYFDIHGEVVWGATAMMLSEFSYVVDEIEAKLQL